jgi:protein-tyrosine phosphatase
MHENRDRHIVFVCTGNTCRSPLAEVLCKKRLADALGCTPDELPARGYKVCSAGLAAYPGDTAALPAQDIAREYGMDLSGHISQPLQPDLAASAYRIICMTLGHLELLRAYYPALGCEPRLLSRDSLDLPDPVGQDARVYRDCAARIWSDLESLVRELVAESGDPLPPPEREGP